MPKRAEQEPAELIVPLNMNSLVGRMLILPNKRSNQEILFVYGQHSTIERWISLAKILNRYGKVTVPDLPGFGGMDSLYKIGQKPSIDTLADYLAAFIKLRYKRRRLTIVGMSFGFVVVTKMLQKYPDLTKKVDLLVSLNGVVHRDDFKLNQTERYKYLVLTSIFSYGLPALAYRYTLLLPKALNKSNGGKTPNQYLPIPTENFVHGNEFETYLWRINNLRTHMSTTNALLKLDNCQVSIKLPLQHISLDDDKRLDNDITEQHLRVVFDNIHITRVKLPSDKFGVMVDDKLIQKLLPISLRHELKRLAQSS